MSDITQCPECQRKLNVPDGQYGTVVRCPACGAEFTAEPFVPPRPAPVSAEPEPPPRPRQPRRDYDDRDDDYPPRRPRYDRGYGGRYGGMLPHRGSSVQTLGVLCLCFCWFWLVCWVLGIIALIMAATDLSQMNNGQMDPSGRAATKSGQICAIIGLSISACLGLFCVGWWVFLAAAVRSAY